MVCKLVCTTCTNKFAHNYVHTNAHRLSYQRVKVLIYSYHTLLYYAYSGLEGTSPFIGVFIILLITMAMEFVVGSATAKAFLLLPLLTPLGNMIGLTSQTVVQAYVFGDGFTNAFYPTSNMLLLISGLMGFSIIKWYKWSWKLILRIVILEIVTLLLCVAIGYGPF